MNALQVMDRYWKEVKQVSTWKNVVKVQHHYDKVADLNSCTNTLACRPNEQLFFIFLHWELLVNIKDKILVGLGAAHSKCWSKYTTWVLPGRTSYVVSLDQRLGASPKNRF